MSGDSGDIYSVSSAARKIRNVLREIKTYGFSRQKPFSVGRVEQRMKDFAENNDIELADGNLYMSSKSISHAVRKTKREKGLTVSDSELAGFPSTRGKMNLYYDTHTKNFTYVSEKSKFIVHPNYEIKGENGKKYRVNFITAQKLSNMEIFDATRYKRV